MFDLDQSIKEWLKLFRRHPAFGHGSVQEMEVHLRDHIDDLISAGKGEKEAFELAVSEFGEIRPMAEEEFENLRRKSRFISISHSSLFYNYLKSATRNIKKHKLFSFINLLGLTMGLTIVLLIGLFVSDELSFDQFHAKKDRIYRVVENQYYEGQEVFPVAVTPTGLGPALVETYPEVLNQTRVSREVYTFELGEKKIRERGGVMVDATFFEILSYPLLRGDLEKFDKHLNSLILCEAMAEKYFPDEDPIGKTISLSGEEYIIYGILKDIPRNSHLQFKYATNFKKYVSENSDRANNFSTNWLYTYVEVVEDHQLDSLNSKVEHTIKDNNEGSVTDIYFQPVPEIYLGTVDFVVETNTKGEMLYVKVFSMVAIFILLISCINFMNLSTARSTNRAKEVGLRKTIGANRTQLIFQFLSESILLSLIAMVFAVIIATLMLPSFNEITHKEMEINSLIGSDLGLKLFLGLLISALITGLIAGSYPAMYLSSIQPTQILSSQVVIVKKRFGLRRTLVVLQFMISVSLIIGTIVVYQQLDYIRNMDIGFNKENIIYLDVTRKKARLFAAEMGGKPGVVSVGLSNRHPAYILSSSSGFQWPGKDLEKKFLMHYMSMDENYFPTMEMRMVEGRNFFHTDTLVVIINERALAMMDLENPIGKKLYGAYDDSVAATIVGVVKDFNFKSVHTPVEPLLVFKGGPESLGMVFIKYENEARESIKGTIDGVYKDVFPDGDLNFYFLDDDFDELYEAEEATGKLSGYFAAFAILISCLGLFGLVSYAAEQRVREIGIRKVYGASVRNLFILQAYDFIRLVVLSLLFSIPIGWYAMSDWLENYAYRVDLSIWVFMGSALIAILISILTVSYQTIRSALRNPADAIRSI